MSDFINQLKNELKKKFNITLDYFLSTISTFYFLVSLIVNKAITINKTSDKKIPLFTDQLNDLLIFSLSDEVGQTLISVPIDLFPLYKSDYLDNNLSKMHDVDKVNWILCNTRFKEAFLN